MAFGRAWQHRAVAKSSTVAERVAAKNSPPESSRAFPRSSRLLTSAAYQRVLRGNNKKLHRSGYMVVRSANAAQHGGRLGFKVGKKYLRRAVDRNRIKRIVREAFRHANSTAGHDWVFIARHDIQQRLHDKQLRGELDKLLGRAGRTK